MLLVLAPLALRAAAARRTSASARHALTRHILRRYVVQVVFTSFRLAHINSANLRVVHLWRLRKGLRMRITNQGMRLQVNGVVRDRCIRAGFWWNHDSMGIIMSLYLLMNPTSMFGSLLSIAISMLL